MEACHTGIWAGDKVFDEIKLTTVSNLEGCLWKSNLDDASDIQMGSQK